MNVKNLKQYLNDIPFHNHIPYSFHSILYRDVCDENHGDLIFLHMLCALKVHDGHAFCIRNPQIPPDHHDGHDHGKNGQSLCIYGPRAWNNDALNHDVGRWHKQSKRRE